MYNGYELDKESRRELLEIFPQEYEKLYAHHITHIFGKGSSKMPEEFVSGEIVGRANDGSLECLIVKINGNLKRPDGKYYHITWSLEEGRKPVESNDISKGYYPLDEPIPFKAKATIFNR